MRFDAVALALVAATVTATAEPAVPARKVATAGYPDAARRDFIEATIAERGGDISRALQKYAASSAKSPQANTYFNMARIELQLDRVRDARAHFARYVELAPRAADRVAIEKLVDQLANADPLVTLGGRVDGHLEAEPAAIILLDGMRVGTSPVTRSVKPGTHEVERVTATTYDRRRFDARTGEREYIELRGRKQPGNVIMAGKRLELAPGHHAVPDVACTPVEFDVTAGAHITYVRLELADATPDKSCRDIRKVTTQKLVLP